jgi:ribosome-binding factor A
VPDLRFELDRGLEHAARINAVLNELKREGGD